MQSWGNAVLEFFKSFLYDWGIIQYVEEYPADSQIDAEVAVVEENKPSEIDNGAVDYSGYWWYVDNIDVAEVSVLGDVDEKVIYEELDSLVEEGELPTIEIPNTAIQALKLLDAEEFDFIEVANTVNHSPGMAAEFLKVVNSTAYGRESKTQDLKIALPWLGRNNTKAMLYLYSTRITVAKNPKLNALAEEIVEHSYATAIVASYLSELYFPDHDMAFLAGLLHDIGKLGIVKTISDKYKLKTSVPVLCEGHFGEVFPDLHEKIGAYLAADWNLDPLVMGSIAHHHDFDTAEFTYSRKVSYNLAALINLSDVIAKILGRGHQLEPVDIFELPAAKALFMKKDARTIAFLEKIPELLERMCSVEDE